MALALLLILVPLVELQAQGTPHKESNQAEDSWRVIESSESQARNRYDGLPGPSGRAGSTGLEAQRTEYPHASGNLMTGSGMVPQQTLPLTGRVVPQPIKPLVLISEPAATNSPTMPAPRLTPAPPASAPVYVLPPQPVPPPVTTYKPLIPVTPPPKRYYLGRGLFGQPKLYVPDQPVRNFLRYFSF
jgi:hypothetical protein